MRPDFHSSAARHGLALSCLFTLQFDTHHLCRSSLTHGREGFCSSVELRWNGQESVHARAELLHAEGYF